MEIIPYDGKPITRPGIYSGVPMSHYHGRLVHRDAGYSVSRSKLWTFFDKSPAHAWDESPYNPNRNPDSGRENDALRFGRACHHLLLGEADFLEHFAIRPETYPEFSTYPDTRGPHKPWAGGAKWCKAWEADNAIHNRSLITETELENIKGMAGGLMALPLVRAGILNGLVEHTIVVQDPETGIWIKVRPDCIPNDSGDFSDLKSAVSVTEDSLEKAIGEHGLFMQAGLTAWACSLLPEPIEVQSFNLVFCEKTRPFCAAVRAVAPAELELGIDCSKVALKAYARCAERSVWPGPGGEHSDANYLQMRPLDRVRVERKLEFMRNEYDG